jgi:hypothetical protein
MFLYPEGERRHEKRRSLRSRSVEKDGYRTMRAEAQAMVNEIEESLALLRRRL